MSINTEGTVKENLRNIFWEAVAFTRFLSDVSLGNYYTRMSCFCKYSKRGSGWCQNFSIFYLNDVILKTKKHFICQICFNFRKEFYCGCRYRYNSVQIDLKYPLQWIQKNAKYSSLKKFNCYYIKDANLLTKL